jgi:Transglycosylase SLT domain
MRRVVAAIALVGLCAAVACSEDGGDDHRAKEETRIHGPEDVPVPDSRGEIAASLARVERALRDPSTPPADLERLSWEQQNAYRALSAHPQWVDDVIADVPGDLRPVVAANENAGRQLAELGNEGEAPRRLPDWDIVSPLPAEQLRDYYGEAEAASGIPWAYLASIHLVETRLGRIRGTSSAGAQGPMQFIPATWERYGQGDINDNHDAILAAARLLQDNGGPGDMSRALYRYNNSNRYVAAVQSYAQLMLADEGAFLGYYEWQVHYATSDGTFLLPEGYPDEPAERLTPSD